MLLEGDLMSDSEDRTRPLDPKRNDETRFTPDSTVEFGLNAAPSNSNTSRDDATQAFEPIVSASNRRQVKYFGEYELLEEIARGGMGVVFKARQVTLDRTVALKMILSGDLASPEAIERFRIEAEAAAKLDHPGIVPIFEIGQHNGQHYFSMGFVEGQSLAQYVKNGPIASRQAAEILKRIADAIAYAHQQGVIHRDLKPANVLMDAKGEPRVTDFGLAKQVHSERDLTRTGDVMGTPSYMPPEQAAGKSDVGPLADIYSLGALLYALLTGRPPFQSANVVDTIMQVIELDPVPPRQLDPKIERDLETICLKCLSKSPSHRYPSAIELSADIDRFLNDQPILARPPGWLEMTNQWARNHVATVVTLMTLLGLSVLFLPTIPLFLAAIQPNQDRKILSFATPLQSIDSAQARGIEQGMTLLLQTQPENKAARFDKAIALLSQQKYAASIDELSVLAHADSQNPELLFTRALANYRLNQVESAQRDLAKCIELRPNWPGPFFLRAEIHLSQDSLRAALHDVDQAILLHPGQIDGYLLRKNVHERLGNYGAAIIDERMIQSLRTP